MRPAPFINRIAHAPTNFGGDGSGIGTQGYGCTALGTQMGVVDGKRAVADPHSITLLDRKNQKSRDRHNVLLVEDDIYLSQYIA
jgi:hypothetical protein